MRIFCWLRLHRWCFVGMHPNGIGVEECSRCGRQRQWVWDTMRFSRYMIEKSGGFPEWDRYSSYGASCQKSAPNLDSPSSR